MPFFLEIIQLLVEEEKITSNNWTHLTNDLIIQEMYSFLFIIVQVGHDLYTKTINSCGTV
jgi:hypothetical protein